MDTIQQGEQIGQVTRGWARPFGMHTQVQSAQPAATGGLQFESHLPRQQRLGQLIQLAQTEPFVLQVEQRSQEHVSGDTSEGFDEQGPHGVRVG